MRPKVLTIDVRAWVYTNGICVQPMEPRLSSLVMASCCMDHAVNAMAELVLPCLGMPREGVAFRMVKAKTDGPPSWS